MIIGQRDEIRDAEAIEKSVRQKMARNGMGERH